MTTLISVTLAGYPRALPESLVYRSAWGYGLAMRVLYGRYYAARDAAVAAHIPDGASVLELCCGPARLYLHELNGRVGSYAALDASQRFVQRLLSRGVDARCADVARAELPVADVVVMQASLYHFMPEAEAMIRRMRAASRMSTIIAEPVRNLASSRLGIVARLGAGGAATQQGAQSQRFDEDSLHTLMERFGDAVVSSEPIPGGREHVYVLSGMAR
ncbi:MAG TPA: class I SAM-dependent methyltransferase [Solirubrobacteraceae bacterium]|jgi:SAM-dependent methyltransferase|nr:class I SAM-dependent methyltransferase [Solirubrobacteraceae bacterium]